MFTTQQECQWWAERWRFTRNWKHERTNVLVEMSRVNYRNLIVATFTHLFNVRLEESGKCL